MSVGGQVVARYVAVRAGRLELRLGPDLAIFGRPVVVQVNGSELFRLPLVVAGLSLEATADLSAERDPVPR